MAVSPTQLKLLKRLLLSGSDVQVIHAIEKIHPSDISFLFSELPDGEIKRLIDCLVQVKKAGQTLKEIPEFFLPDILELIDDDKLTEIVTRLEPDDALYILGRLPDHRWQGLLARLEPRLKNQLEKLLVYPKDSAGAVMNSNYIAVSVANTIEEAIQALRASPDREGIFYVYVVDGRKLVGVLPLRSLVIADGKDLVRNHMLTNVFTVQVTEDQERAAQLVSQYNLLALPVVNDQQELLGVITVDDVIDIFEEEATEDLYHMAGLSEEDRAFTPVFTKARKRLPWFLINLITAFGSVFVISFFESTIARVAILAAFMPVVAGMGGNSGTQSLIVMTRSIALGEMAFASASRAILKEFANGVIIGLIIGSIAGVFGFLWVGNLYLGLIVFLALIANMMVAALMGTTVPLLFKRFKFDPAIGSGIFVTAGTDIIGFFLFLGLARLFIARL